MAAQQMSLRFAGLYECAKESTSLLSFWPCTILVRRLPPVGGLRSKSLFLWLLTHTGPESRAKPAGPRPPSPREGAFAAVVGRTAGGGVEG